MAEFSLGYDQGAAAAPGGGVEWYSAGTGGYDPRVDYSYSAGPSSTAAYATFDDEPPLLEGDSRAPGGNLPLPCARDASPNCSSGARPLPVTGQRHVIRDPRPRPRLTPCQQFCAHAEGM